MCLTIGIIGASTNKKAEYKQQGQEFHGAVHYEIG